MFDIGWTEMAVIVVLALIVVGPKDLPKALRTIRAVMAKLRDMGRELQSGVDELIREAELKEMRDEVESSTRDVFEADFDYSIDPAGSGEKQDQTSAGEVNSTAGAAAEAAGDRKTARKGATGKGGTAKRSGNSSSKASTKKKTAANPRSGGGRKRRSASAGSKGKARGGAASKS